MTADGNSGGNFNRYKYTNNNPYKFTDPDGRQSASAMDRRFVYPYLDSEQVEGLEAQHDAIGEKAFYGMKLGAEYGVGGIVGRGLWKGANFVLKSKYAQNVKFGCAFAICIINPNAKIITLEEPVRKTYGQRRISDQLEGVARVGDAANKRRTVAEGVKSGSAVGAPGSGVHSGNYNADKGTATVHLERETGSHIRQSREVCVNKEMCGN